MRMFTLCLLAFCLTAPALLSQTIPEDLHAPAFDDLQWVSDGWSASSIEGQNTVLEFWSTTCGSCIKSIGHINELADKFGKDIRFVSVALENDAEKVKDFLEKTEIRTAVCLGDQEFREEFGGSWIPRTVIIDKEGMVRWTGRPGQLTNAILEEFVSQNTIPAPPPKRELLFLSVKEAEERDHNTPVEWDPERNWMKWYEKSLTSFLDALIGYVNLRDKPVVVFEGGVPLEPMLDIEMSLDSTKADFQMYQVALDAMQQSFGFSYRYEMRRIHAWLMTPKDLAKLGNAQNVRAVAQYEHPRMEYEETETDIVLKNVDLDRLLGIVSNQFDKTIRTYSSTPGYFDITFPKDDFNKARRHLFMQYGLEIVEKDDVLTKYCIVSFPEKKAEKEI